MKYNKVNFQIGAEEQLLQDARDVLAAMLGDCGFETFEDTEHGTIGYIQEQFFNTDNIAQTIEDFPFTDVTITYNVEDAEYKNWNEQWENEGFPPITIEKCTIHDGRHLPDNTDGLMVEIDAKLAFGTGNHETTRMIIGKLMNSDLTNKRVLDCGCGTGILGIIAMKRGAQSVVAYDIDEWSADNARHNAVINNIFDNYIPMLGDSSILETLPAHTHFDIIVANINRNILLNDMPRWIDILDSKGTLLISGFYKNDSQILIEKAKELGLSNVEEVIDGEWACLRLWK